jgi:hypothetical protein
MSGAVVQVDRVRLARWRRAALVRFPRRDHCARVSSQI